MVSPLLASWPCQSPVTFLTPGCSSANRAALAATTSPLSGGSVILLNANRTPALSCQPSRSTGSPPKFQSSMNSSATDSLAGRW